MKRTRFSIRRHLQKRGLAHADSDSDLEEEDSEYEPTSADIHMLAFHNLRFHQLSDLGGKPDVVGDNGSFFYGWEEGEFQ